MLEYSTATSNLANDINSRNFQARFAGPIPNGGLADDWFSMVQVRIVPFHDVPTHGEQQGGGGGEGMRL